MHATFLLSKDPVTEHGGDLAVARLIMSLARQSFDVSCICLSSTVDRHDESIKRVPKPPVDLRRIAARSVRSGRSMVHTRFDVDSFVAAIDSSDSDVYVTEHSYMAEPYLRSSKANSSSRFVVSTDVSEALVWKATRGLVGRSESVRIRRDELRVAQSADGIGAFDTEEIEYYRSRGVPNATWLDITMPPKKRIDISHSTPRLVFLGDRTWPPNAEACSLLLRWWPRIAAEIPDAELCIVGKPPPKPSKKPLPDGARELGFVDDLDGFLVTCRALAAPIQTGGGVRVKILEAASQGLPVVATSTGLGSLSTIFDIATFDDKNGFVDRCRELLLDREVAVTEGKRLHAINSDRWHAGEPHSTVNSWLRG